MIISKSLITQFHCVDRDPNRRLGQELYDFLLLHKVKNPDEVVWANKLYNATDEEARKISEVATDHQQ